MPKFLIFILFLFVSCNLQAQTWEVGGTIGGAGYLGDLNPNNPVKPSGVMAGIFVKRNFDGYLSAKLNYAYGKIGAADSTSSNPQFRDRNLSFRDGLSEISLIGEFNFMNYIPDAGPNKYTPFIYAGIAYTNYNPVTTYAGQVIKLRPLQTEGQANQYGKSTLAIPYGLGIKYNISGKLSLMGDIGYRYTFTDYLDDVSGVYPEKSKLSSALARSLTDRSGEFNNHYIGDAGSQRGDMKPHDSYFFIGFTISYTFVTANCYY